MMFRVFTAVYVLLFHVNVLVLLLLGSEVLGATYVNCLNE